MRTKSKTVWTRDVMRIYQRYPAALKSDAWPDIVSAANAGHFDLAIGMAQDHEGTHKSIRAQNVIARRIRIQRVALFALQKQSGIRLRAIFKQAANDIGQMIVSSSKGMGGLPKIKKRMHEGIVALRASLKQEINDAIWKSILLGVKNMGEALKPIIRGNRESFAEELSDVALLEERLSLGLTYHVSGKTNKGGDKSDITIGSDKWKSILDRIYQNIVFQNNEGLTPSDRIWDLTNRMELDLKRKLVTEIANGTSPRDIADQIEKYIYVDGVDEDIQTGPGIYRDPFKNAMRLARTETSRAYADATAAWAENKSWIEGIQPTLSPAHDVSDECDDYAEGDPMDPSEFADTFPVHPHCMCYGTYVIKEDYLTGDEETDNSDQSNTDTTTEEE